MNALKKIAALMLVPLSLSAAAQRYNLLPDTIPLCEGDSAFIEMRHDLGTVSSIQWVTPLGVVSNTKRIRARQQGKYYIRIQRQDGLLSDSVFVKVLQRPVPWLSDTVVCRGRAVQLDAGNPGMRYQWNNGETTRRIQVTAGGRYWVRVSNGRCWRVDTARVRMEPAALPLVVPAATFCLSEENKVLSSRAGPGEGLLWSNGATTATMAVTREGEYWLRFESGACGVYSDTVNVRFKACDCEMIIPNSFTPNEDNRNDYFFPVLQCDYTFFSITVTDRWGYTVYASNNPAGKWDGRFKGHLCPEDIYVYRIESQEKGSDKKQVRTGQISLFR